MGHIFRILLIWAFAQTVFALPNECEPPACREACRDGYVKDENSCDTCECIMVCQNFECGVGSQCVPMEAQGCEDCPRVPMCMMDTCMQMMDSGSCRDREQRWFFDSQIMQCDIFQYGGCGGNYNNFLTREECEETCVPVRDILPAPCEEFTCLSSLSCSNGYKKDALGCDICECEPEEQGCPPVCNLFCEYGMVKDENGCYLCECNAQAACLKLEDCNISCEHGIMAQDAHGCDMCECYDPCKEISCPSGHLCVVQQTHCLAEFCRPTATCRQDFCHLEPETGYCRASFTRWFFNPESDDCEEFVYGGCRGNQNNFHSKQQCLSQCNAGGLEEVGCPTVMCDMVCHHGLKTTDLGCEVCECDDPPPCPPVCMMHCKYGMEEDENGCQICKCKDKPQCPMLDTCDLTCPSGFVVDDNDCQMCSCVDPCKDTVCEPGYMCDVSSECTSEPCTYEAMCRQQLCFLPVSMGMCRAIMPRWYFSLENDTCEMFVYGGCGGNPNNFETESQCLEACSTELDDVTECQTPTCDMLCDGGWKQDDNGCDICECENSSECPDMSDCQLNCTLSGYLVDLGCQQCQCKEPCEDYACGAGHVCIEEVVQCIRAPCPHLAKCVPEDIPSVPSLCLLPREVGPCRAMRRMWYYNSDIGDCQSFLYGGCEGNQNRFVSKAECLQSCAGLTTACPPVDCPEHCQHGIQSKQDSNGCMIQCGCQCPPACDLPCQHGHLRDGEGCDVCMCAPPPCPTCPVSECLYGHLKDEEGCDRCGECFTDPCKDYHQCGIGEMCVAQELVCESDSCSSNLMLQPGCVKESKGGRCPAVASVTHLPDACTTDADCPEQNKCCGDIEGDKSCTSPDFPMPCLAEAETGSCNNKVERWYFDMTKGECLTFMYSGCDGNENRFLTKASCDGTCGAVYSCPIQNTPLPQCQFGPETDLNGCPTSVCKADPCFYTKCSPGYICQHVLPEDCSDPVLCPLTASCISAVNKVGECPSSVSWPLSELCLHMCSDDSKCAGPQKCCNTGCGRICVSPQNKDVDAVATQCTVEQQKSLSSLHMDSMHSTFVPMCDSHGLYQVIQCNLHLGVCWCVDPNTGGALAGTQTHGVPDCSAPQSASAQICGSGVPLRRCNPLLCSSTDCPGRPDALCRVNPCGENCTVEFYDTLGRNIPQAQCHTGLSFCHTQQALRKQQMTAMMWTQMEYSALSQRDFQGHYMRLLRHNERQMMEVYMNRQHDPSTPERPNGRPLPAEHIERGIPEEEHIERGIPEEELPTEHMERWMPEEVEVTPGPDGNWRGMPVSTDPTLPLFQGQSTVPYPYIPPAPREPVAPNNLYIPQCRPFYEHYHGGYQFKQCTAQFCWCVDSGNEPIEGTLTDSRGLLTCSRQGRVESQSSDAVECSDGSIPSVCVTEPQDAMCLGVAGLVRHVVNPCQNCAVTFYTEDWVPIDPLECRSQPEVSPCSSETDQCQGWLYDAAQDQCIHHIEDACQPGAVEFTEQHCLMSCKAMSCAEGMSESACTDACHNASCVFYPEALCMTDMCTCTPYFVDPVTNTRVDCHQGTDMCTRYQAVVAEMKMMSGEPTSQSNIHTPCHHTDSLRPDRKVHFTVKFSSDFSLVADPDNMDSFKSSMRSAVALMLQIQESLIEVIQVVEGSIIAEVEIRDVDNDIVSRMGVLEKWVVDGHLAEALGEDFVMDQTRPFSVFYTDATTIDTSSAPNVTMERGEKGETMTVRGDTTSSGHDSSSSSTTVTIKQQTETSSVKPSAGAFQSDSPSINPSTITVKSDRSSTTAGTTTKPSASTSKPDSSSLNTDTTTQPSSSTFNPDSPIKKLSTSTYKPDSSSMKMGTTINPSTSTSITPSIKPSTRTVKPDSSSLKTGSTMKQTSSTLQPYASSTRSSTGTNKPDTPSKPTDTTMKPSTSTIKPDPSSLKSGSTMKQTSSTLKPYASSTRLSTGTNKPDTPSKPTDTNMKPSTSTIKPDPSSLKTGSTMKQTSSTLRPYASSTPLSTGTKTPDTSSITTDTNIKPSASTIKPDPSSLKTSSTMKQTSSTLKPNAPSTVSNTSTNKVDTSSVTTDTPMKPSTSTFKPDPSTIKTGTTRKPTQVPTKNSSTSTVKSDLTTKQTESSTLKTITTIKSEIKTSMESDSLTEVTTSGLVIDDIKVNTTPSWETSANDTSEDLTETTTRGYKDLISDPAIPVAQSSKSGLSSSDTAVLVVACLLLAMFVVIAVAVVIRKSRNRGLKKNSGLSSYPSSEHGIMEHEEKASTSDNMESPRHEAINGISYA